MQRDKDTMALEAHFKQWKEVPERMKTIFLEDQKQQAQLKENLQRIIESQYSFQKALENSIFARQERYKSIVNPIEMLKIDIPDITPFIKQQEEYKKSIKDTIGSIFKDLQRSFRGLPPHTQEALLLLGTHGWYMDLEMPLPWLWELEKALADGNTGEAENALVEHFENRLDEIEQSIVNRFPNRDKLVHAAFNAHRKQEYELSIPVFLSQTDGICKEVVNKYLFLKHDKKPQTAIYVEEVAADTFKAALLIPLAQTLPITASEHERENGFSGLNRHMVLHGESLDYGTKINGLKAISLINYVVHVLKGK